MYPNLINYDNLNKEIIEINFKKTSLKLNLILLFILLVFAVTIVYFNKNNSKKDNKKKYLEKLKYIHNESNRILNM